MDDKVLPKKKGIKHMAHEPNPAPTGLVSSLQATGYVLLLFPGLLLHCNLRLSQLNDFPCIFKVQFWLQALGRLSIAESSKIN